MAGQIKASGLIVGLIGNALVAYALFTLLSGAGCVGGPSVCNDAMLPGMFALPAGIILSMIGMFMGGAFFIFCGLFLAIGLGSIAAAIFSDMGEMRSFGWIFGGLFSFFGLLPVA